MNKPLSICRAALTASLFWFLLAAVMYYCYHETPMMQDDYRYSLLYSAAEHETTGLPILTLSDYAEAVRQIYWGIEGRLSNFIIAFCLTLGGGKAIFNILGTLAFTSLVAFLSYYTFRSLKLLPALICAAAVFVFFPCPEGTILWCSGTVNYVWGALLLMPVLFVLRRLLNGTTIPRPILLSGTILFFLLGMYHEALGLPLLTALCGLMVLDKRARQPFIYGWCGCMALGFFLMMLSPGHMQRVASSQDVGLVGMMVQNTLRFIEHSLPPVGIILVAAVLTRFRLFRPGQWSAMDKLLLLWIGANTGVVVLKGFAGAWGGAYFYLNFSLLLFFLQQLKPFPSRPLVRFFSGMTAVGVLSVSLCTLMGIARFGRYFYETSLAQAQAGASVCTVDCREWNSFVIAGTPADSPFGAECKPASVIGHTSHPFYVVTNDLVENRCVYQSSLSAPADEFVWTQQGHLLLIRLPQSYFCPDSEVRCRWNNGQLGSCLRQNILHSPLQVLVRRTLKGKTLLPLGKDYYRGHHYVIVRHDGNCPDELLIPLQREDSRNHYSVLLSPSEGWVKPTDATRF